MHPNRRRPIVPIATGLLIALAALIPAALSTSAQENGLASITIYSSLCPPNYQEQDFYTDCYETPAGEGIVFTLTNLDDPSDTYTGTSGPSGFAAIEGIDQDGFYQLSFDVPFPISNAPGNCSEDGNAFPVGSEYQMDLTTDNDIRCDIFISPQGEDPVENGTLTIYNTACPVGYDGTDYFEDCYDNPVEGVTFTASPQRENPGEGGGAISGKTNANGVVALTLPQFTYGVSADIPGDFIDRFFVYCSLNGQRHEIGMNDFRILVDIPGGADVRCDWYIVPTDARGDDPGSVTIYNTTCPAGYAGTSYYPDCYNNPRSGAGFSISAQKLDFWREGATDANGYVTLPLATEGWDFGYTLSAQPLVEVPGGSKAPFVVYCTVDGQPIDVRYGLVQLDPGGDAWTVSISPEYGDDVRCDWYNLVPKRQIPTTPTPPSSPVPVTQLPSTGTGTSPAPAAGALMVGIAMLGAAGAWALNRASRRHAA